MKLIRFVISVPVLVVGVLLAVYGFFALTFNEPGGGSTYVTLMGHRLDAHNVGAGSLAVGLVFIAAAIAIVRRRRLGS